MKKVMTILFGVFFMMVSTITLNACSDEDEPQLSTRTEMPELLGAEGVNVTITSEPFNPAHDAIDTSGQYEIDEAYAYPIKPGYGSGWNELDPEDVNLAKTQVPQELVEKMTTRALVETCIEHPMALHYLHGEGFYGEFIERLIENNNAFKELSKRPDAGWELAIAYNNLKFPVNGLIEESHMNSTVIWGFVELMLEKDIFFNQLTDLQVTDLYKALLTKYYIEEQNYPYYFSLHPVSIGLTMLPMAKVVLKIGSFQSDEARSFLENYVKNWDSFKTTEKDVLQAIQLTTGSDMKAYEKIDVAANIDKLLGTWKVVSYAYTNDWRDYENDETITFKEQGNVEGNWLGGLNGSYTIEGNVIKIVSGRKDYGGMAIDYVMNVIILKADMLECYAFTTWIASSWSGSWFRLQRVN